MRSFSEARRIARRAIAIKIVGRVRVKRRQMRGGRFQKARRRTIRYVGGIFGAFQRSQLMTGTPSLFTRTNNEEKGNWFCYKPDSVLVIGPLNLLPCMTIYLGEMSPFPSSDLTRELVRTELSAPLFDLASCRV